MLLKGTQKNGIKTYENGIKIWLCAPVQCDRENAICSLSPTLCSAWHIRIWLAPEQHGFELHKSTYMWIFLFL